MTEYQREVLRCIDLEEIGMADVAKANTEKYRKGAFAVTVVGADGAPLKGAKLRFDLKNHDFKFGSTTFLADTITKPQEARLYRERFAKLFNQGVVAFYWRDDEPTEGHCRFKKDSPYIYRRPPADTALEFCKDVGAQPKGHNLIWQNDAIGIPDWAKDDPEHLKSALIKRIRKIAEEYGDKIPVWDVTNECTGFYNHHMPQGYDTLAWLLATKLMSDNHLILNDYACFFDDFRGPFSALYLQAQKLMAQGAKIDAVGMQYHLFEDKAGLLNKARHSNMLNARHIYHVLDTYATLGTAMHVSEVTVPSHEGSAEGLELQARMVENLYRLWFSHPAVGSIVWWNLADGFAFRHPSDPNWNENAYGGGLLRHDLSAKPAYDVLDRLINTEWHTDEKTETGENGFASFSGFYGTYTVTVSHGGKETHATVHFEKGKTNYTITV